MGSDEIRGRSPMWILWTNVSYREREREREREVALNDDRFKEKKGKEIYKERV